MPTKDNMDPEINYYAPPASNLEEITNPSIKSTNIKFPITAMIYSQLTALGIYAGYKYAVDPNFHQIVESNLLLNLTTLIPLIAIKTPLLKYIFNPKKSPAVAVESFVTVSSPLAGMLLNYLIN
jgi:hypothetical protein